MTLVAGSPALRAPCDVPAGPAGVHHFFLKPPHTTSSAHVSRGSRPPPRVPPLGTARVPTRSTMLQACTALAMPRASHELCVQTAVALAPPLASPRESRHVLAHLLAPCAWLVAYAAAVPPRPAGQASSRTAASRPSSAPLAAAGHGGSGRRCYAAACPKLRCIVRTTIGDVFI